MNRKRRNKEISSAATLDHRRSARSESQPRPVGKRSCDIEALLDPLEIRGDEQLRRRRRECARRQKNRRTDRAIIVIVGRNLHRRMRFGASKRGGLCAYRKPVLRQTVQMDVTEGDYDLQGQRNQRQQRAVPFMATNPAHPHQPSPTTMLALQHNIWQEAGLCGGLYGLEPDQVTKKSASARSSWYVMSLRSRLARKLITRTLPGR
jgi:hypothetical protein